MNVVPAASYYAPNLPTGTWRSPGYRSARLRARSSYVTFGFLLFAAVMMLVAHWNEWTLLDRLEGRSFVSFAEAVDADNLVAEALGWYIIFSIAVGVCFLAWLSRSVDNTPPLLAGTPERSPREAIGWWFVPIASFVVPYQIVRDLFERLAIPQRSGGKGRLLTWWLLFVGMAIVSVVAQVVTGASVQTAQTGPLKEADAVWIVADVVRIVAILFTFWLIHEIQTRADSRAAALGLSPEGVPVWPTQPYVAPPTPPYPTAPSAVATGPSVYPNPPAGPAYGGSLLSAPVAAAAPSAPIATPAVQPLVTGPAPVAPPVEPRVAPPPAPLPAGSASAIANEYCPSCGEARIATMRFCASCGSDLAATTVPPPTVP